MVKLIGVTKSPKPGKKWRATFKSETGREKNTDFGDSKAQDYTQHGDKTRRDAYRNRHAKDLATKDPTRAGFLSWYILWGDSTSFQENLKNYKSKFNL
jgi:hypothetical protein